MESDPPLVLDSCDLEDTMDTIPKDDERCLATLKEHFEIIMQRFDVQDALLNQMITRRVGSKGTAGLAANRETSQELRSGASGTSGMDGANESSFSMALRSRERAAGGSGGSTSWSVHNMFGGLITRTPRVFKSHSREDMEAKHDALTAHTSHVRQLYKNAKKDMNRVEKSRKTCYMYLQEFVEHPGFDIFFACVVIANAVFVGLDVENNIKSPTTPRPVSLDVAQYTFTVLFSAELGLRFAAGGVYNMICSEDWMWTILDVVVVATSIWEIVFQLIYALQGEDVNDTSVTGLSSLKAFRIIRVTRILKTAQLVRIFRFVMALRTLVQSVVHTLKALLWAMLLLLLIVYVFAVLFAQAVHDYKIDAGNPPLSEREESASQIYFASLTETMLTLFMSIAGGVSWEEPVSTLKEISGWWTALYFAYIAFTYFAVLNVVTAVFCQSAIESASKDHTTVVQNMLDNKAAHLQKLRELFSKIGDESTGAITFGVFEEKISDQPVRDYFETLGLDVWDPWAFFKLLDTDGGGSVEVEEFFMGCLRFSGQASAMDVGKIIQDQSWLMKNQGRFQSYMEQELVKLREDLASFIATASCAPNVKSALI